MRGYWLEDYLPMVLGGGGILALLGYFAFAWFKVGRDPATGTIIPLFAPPKDMSAPAVRYVYEMGFDDRAFSSGIVQLAVNGGAKLIDAGSDMQINHLGGGRDPKGPIDAMAKALFRNGSQLLLNNTNHERVSAGKSALQGALSDQYAGKLFTNNYGWTSVGVLIWFIMAAAVILGVFVSYGPEMGGLSLFANAFADCRRADCDRIAAGVAHRAKRIALGHPRNSVRRSFRSRGCGSGIFRRTQYRAGGDPAAARDRVAASGDLAISCCARRASPAARSWMRSRASSNISASPRKTG